MRSSVSGRDRKAIEMKEGILIWRNNLAVVNPYSEKRTYIKLGWNQIIMKRRKK